MTDEAQKFYELYSALNEENKRAVRRYLVALLSDDVSTCRKLEKEHGLTIRKGE